jgi:hypothetical protein
VREPPATLAMLSAFFSFSARLTAFSASFFIALMASRSARLAPALASEATHRPAARRRRERLQTAGWFVLGGVGGLLLASAVHLMQMVLAWR